MSTSQLDIKQQKLIAIALNVTERFFYIESTSLHLSKVRDYEIWRDRNYVAIVNAKTHQPIVFGKVSANSIKPITKGITKQSLWQKIQQQYPQLVSVISIEEIESAWLFFRPLDPAIQNLNQIQPIKTKHRRLSIASQNAVRKLTKVSHTVFDLKYSFSRSKSTIDSII